MPEECTTRLEQLASSLAALLANLHTLLPDEDMEDAWRPDRVAGASDELLAHLEELLARDDAASNQVFAAAAPRLRRLAGADFSALEQAIAAYDYPQALALVRRLRAGDA